MEQNKDVKRFSGLFGAVARHPRLILALALLLSVLAVLLTKEKMSFLTGRDDLMPRNAPFQREYRANRAEFGDKEEIVVVIESKDEAKAAAFGSRLYERLAADRGRFREVFFPAGLPFFRTNGLLFMSVDELRTLRRNLTMAKPVLKALAASPSVQTLFTRLTGQIDDYLRDGGARPGSPAELTSIAFMLDKLGAGIATVGTGGGKELPSLEATFLGGDDSALARAGRMQILTVLPVRDATSFVPAEEAIRTIRGEVARLKALPEFAGVTAGLTGTPVLEFEEMATSQRDIAIATGLSLVLTVVLLLLAFRGILNVIAAMVSLVVAICLSFGLATLVVGHLNILSMVFAVMLIGIGIEYGIQVVLRYQEELGAGAEPLDAIATGLNRNFWAILMAAATTAAAFFTFVFTDFRGIAELGIIAALGIGVCVLVTFTVLPAMLVLLAKYRRPAQSGRTNVRRTSGDGSGALRRFLFGHPRAVVTITAILCAASIYPLLETRFDYNLLNLQAKGLESVEYAYKLMRSKENSGYFAVATAGSAAEAQELTRRLEALPAVDHVVSLLSLVPDHQPEKLAELAALRRELADVNPVPYDEDLQVMALPTVFENFRNAVVRLNERLVAERRPEARQIGAFLATLDRFFATLEKEKDKNALGMLRDFQGGMLASLPAQLGQLKESLNARPVTVADIPPQLRERFIGKSGRYLLQIAPREEIFERGPLQRFLTQVRTVVPNVNGEPVMVYESMTIMRNAYLWAFAYAFVAIVVILLLTFRSVTYAAIGLVPLVVGILLMVGGMWLGGISFNSANIIVMPLILGIAVDSGIYIINRFRREDGDAAAVVMSSTGLGVIYNTLTIMASFGALMVAHHQGVFSIGAVMSLGMVACQAAFILVLPAVLTLVGKK